ncbi:MAG: UDP-glucose 4-epimerase GalE [Candidatus Nephrothrix sp. EaCA]|nr:MAG: UDP-glucose 4-epimerase GalE [Candidatus Nephrothrix sp. EaCA]
MSKQKILVTGGAGYIGAHTAVALLQAGFKPVIIDDLSKSDETLLKGIKKLTGVKPDFYKGSCASKPFVKNVFKKEKNIAGVIHFAAFKSVSESVTQPIKYYRNNIDSLLTLLEVMPYFGVGDIIFSSSCTVYGQPDAIPVNEDAPFKKAESPYGATKQICEYILEDAKKQGFRSVALRYFNPIGAHSSALIGELPIDVPANLVPYITQTAIGKREKLTVFGNDYDTPDGTCLRDFIHVMDLADAHLSAWKYLQQQTKESRCDVFNVGTGNGTSVLELIKEFERVTKQKLNYSIGARREGDVVKTYADPARAFDKLKWKPAHTLGDALLHAWNWEKKLAKR